MNKKIKRFEKDKKDIKISEGAERIKEMITKRILSTYGYELEDIVEYSTINLDDFLIENRKLIIEYLGGVIVNE
jgi:hypothetical protein